MGGVDLLLLTQSWKQLGDAAVRTLSTHSAPLRLSGPTAAPVVTVSKMTSLPVISGQTQQLVPSEQVS